MSMVSDLLSGKTSDNVAMTGLLGEAVAEVDKAKRESLQVNLVSDLSRMDSEMKRAVEYLRATRRTEKAAAKVVDEIEAARNHFKATGNPGPFFLSDATRHHLSEAAAIRAAKRSLADMLGLSVEDIEDSDLMIPKE